ncbi:helix-turn-helix transcriptional regulator [Neobacillus drentensis]|uniref:helix-turn-helix domain-containing protein n=1 Tax=Neobacillus drentensis TaxID=220684 RepID=UPI00300369D7
MTSKHINKYNQISIAIKEARNTKNITQKELAENLGISMSYLSKIEAPNTEKSFSLELLFDIAESLNIPVIDLFKYIKE